MKKLLVILAGLMFSTGLFAAEAGRVMVTLYGGAGVGFTSGEFTAIDDAKSDTTYPYTLGGQIGFFFSDDNALVFGAAYSYSPFKISAEDSNGDKDSFEIYSKFIEFNVGYRGYAESIFWGLGFSYGKKTGDWGGHLVLTGLIDDKFDVSPDDEMKDNISLYLEAGMAIPVAEAVNFDLGVKLNIGLTVL